MHVQYNFMSPGDKQRNWHYSPGLLVCQMPFRVLNKLVLGKSGDVSVYLESRLAELQKFRFVVMRNGHSKRNRAVLLEVCFCFVKGCRQNMLSCRRNERGMSSMS